MSSSQFRDEVEALARFMSHDLHGDYVFDGNDHGDAPGRYRTEATAILRFVRSLGWQEPPRVAGS